MNISVIGSINMDLVYRVPHIVKEGETLHSSTHSVHFGGKGANQAVTASQLGANVSFIGSVGNDAFGKQAKENLANNGVNIASVKEEGSTGQAIIQVADSGENSIVLYPGANFQVTPEQIEQETEVIRNSDALLLQLEIPLDSIERAIHIAAGLGKIIILNPAPAKPLPDSLLKRVSILTPNETELSLLTGIEPKTEEKLAAACQVLLDKGIGTVVVTLGSKGAFYKNKDEQGWVEAVKVDAVDTTGAGDAFNGALAVSIGEGKSLSGAIRTAAKVAAYVVTKMGAQQQLPDFIRNN
ncbi:ribokinase [Bacillus sp. FJAT-27245]|uniref:ribokinase n=1 Tax=Bacillus sp. FJAT-27245 TaxID=1684144 RepID=UPI0006A7A417|nr:ribokinase [Bacillus sp. FJAT-27245]